jgi:hypothetical protein
LARRNEWHANELIGVPGISVFAATEWYLFYVGQNNCFPAANMHPALLAAFCHLDSEELISSEFPGKVWKFPDKPANPYKGKDAGGGGGLSSGLPTPGYWKE